MSEVDDAEATVIGAAAARVSGKLCRKLAFSNGAVCAALPVLRRRYPQQQTFHLPAGPVLAGLGVVFSAVLVAAMGWTAWSGFRSRPSDSRKWYDRAIRAIGGLIILAALAFGLIQRLSE